MNGMLKRDAQHGTICGGNLRGVPEQPGMYGPPLRRKRNVRMSQVGLRKCIRPLLE